MTPATIAPVRLMPIRNFRRSSRSLMAPERSPRKKKGAILAAAATPTMNGEPVMSKISQPTATFSMPVPREYRRVEAHKSLKSRKWREAAHGAFPTKRTSAAGENNVMHSRYIACELYASTAPINYDAGVE